MGIRRWHPWFAWRPVRLQTSQKIVWLKKIYRRYNTPTQEEIFAMETEHQTYLMGETIALMSWWEYEDFQR